MIKILVVDDELDARENVLRMLSRLDFDISCDLSISVQEALEKLSLGNYNLLLLDIQLSDGTGFDILEKTEDRNFQVIFITAYDQYAIRAFKYHAFDYLLKPIDFDDFKSTISELIDKINNNIQPVSSRELDEISKNYKDPKKITIPYKSGFIYLPINEIIYLEADGSYTTIYTNSERYIVSKKLKFFEELLCEQGFCRIHASYIINLSRLKIFTKNNGGEVELDNGLVLSVSRARRNDFLETIK